MHSPHIYEEQFMLYLSLIALSPKHDETVNDPHQVYVRLQDWAQAFVLIVDLTDRHFTAYTIKDGSVHKVDRPDELASPKDSREIPCRRRSSSECNGKSWTGFID